jgi:hypothetical protein
MLSRSIRAAKQLERRRAGGEIKKIVPEPAVLSFAARLCRKEFFLNKLNG